MIPPNPFIIMPSPAAALEIKSAELYITCIAKPQGTKGVRSSHFLAQP